MTTTKRLSAMQAIREDLVLVHYPAANRYDILHALADLLFQCGATKDTYCQAMLDREALYPTGLPTEGIRVALPHADALYVNFSALAVATLQKSVQFQEMGGEPDSLLDVEIVLMLANADPEEQVETLRMLVDFFDEPSVLESLLKAETPAQIVSLLRQGYYRRDNDV
jgi:PTS system galactitol-specific IIA component